MSIRTISSATEGARTLAMVEVKYELPGRGQNYTAWEFSCDDCDRMLTGLTEREARDEFATHVCPETYRCGKCGRDVVRADVGLGDPCPHCGQPTARL